MWSASRAAISLGEAAWPNWLSLRALRAIACSANFSTPIVLRNVCNDALGHFRGALKVSARTNALRHSHPTASFWKARSREYSMISIASSVKPPADSRKRTSLCVLGFGPLFAVYLKLLPRFEITAACVFCVCFPPLFGFGFLFPCWLGCSVLSYAGMASISRCGENPTETPSPSSSGVFFHRDAFT